MKDTKLMKQLHNNVESLVYMYQNGQYDCGEEEYPNMTGQQWFDYCVPEIYNIKCDGYGREWCGDGICEELKFLGNAVIYNIIADIADSEGLLVK